MKKYRKPEIFSDSTRNAFPAIMAGALKAGAILAGYAAGRAVAKAAGVYRLNRIKGLQDK